MNVYPKSKYALGKTGDIAAKKIQGETLVVTTVHNEVDEKTLGPEWKDSPAEFGIETAPAAQPQAVAHNPHVAQPKLDTEKLTPAQKAAVIDEAQATVRDEQREAKSKR